MLQSLVLKSSDSTSTTPAASTMGGASVTDCSIDGDNDGGSLGAFPPPVVAPPPVAAVGPSRSLRGQRLFPQEVWRRGEPCLRPATGHVLLARTPSMDVQEAHCCGHVLMATVVGEGGDLVTPGTLLDAIEKQSGVLPSELCIQVACPPHDLLLWFSTPEKCTCSGQG